MYTNQPGPRSNSQHHHQEDRVLQKCWPTGRSFIEIIVSKTSIVLTRTLIVGRSESLLQAILP